MHYLRFIFLSVLLTPAVIAKPVNDFSFQDVNGKIHQLSDYRGKWVAVNYWATFCPPCRVETPALIRFVNDHPNKLVVLGMDVGMDDTTSLQKFITEQGINYPIIPTQSSTMTAFGEVAGVPVTFIISPEGELVDKHIGLLTYDNLSFYTNPEKSMADDPQPERKKSFWDRIFDWG